jgi:hypothetical protein
MTGWLMEPPPCMCCGRSMKSVRMFRCWCLGRTCRRLLLDDPGNPNGNEILMSMTLLSRHPEQRGGVEDVGADHH